MLKLFLGILIVFQTSFYNLQLISSSGSAISMNNYQGKKVLLVNIATGSNRVNQLAELQLLQQQYSDSLVVLAFPSNSFGNEARSDSSIQSFCTNTYNTTFTIARKGSVLGGDVQMVYNWLTKESENGVTNGTIQGDFQKYLVSSSGEIIGVFAPRVSPLDTVITHAVMRDL